MKNAIIIGIMAASIFTAGLSSSVAQTQDFAVVAKAKGIVLAEFNLEGVTLAEAVRQLGIASKQTDPGKGVNLMVTKSATTATTPKITLALKKVTMDEAVQRIATAAGVRVKVTDYSYIFDVK